MCTVHLVHLGDDGGAAPLSQTVRQPDGPRDDYAVNVMEKLSDETSLLLEDVEFCQMIGRLTSQVAGAARERRYYASLGTQGSRSLTNL